MCRSIAVPGLLILAEAAGLAQGLPLLQPGVEISVPFPPLKNALIVRLPDDYTPDRSWPVVFHFHGTGGRPTIDIPLACTEGKSFVLVGMEYLTRDLPATTPDYLEREWASLIAVRDALAGSARIDLKRVFVGGFSQGGWFASEFMETHGRELAGAYILGAGKRPRNKREPKPFGGVRPVYLGAGQLDLNYPYAINGIKHFAGLGGRVTFEDYLGLGHQMPMGGGGGGAAPGLTQWLRIEALRDRPEEARGEAAAWLRGQIERADADQDHLLSWLRLSRAARQPFFAVVAESERKAAQDRLAAIEKRPPMAKEIAARTRYFQLIERELRGASDGDLWRFARDQALRYAALWGQFPETYHGKRAALELARLGEQCAKVGMWRFPDEATKQKCLAEAVAKPLPEAPVTGLVREFKGLGSALVGNAD